MIFCCYLTDSIVNLYNNAKTDLAFIDQSTNTILKAFDINVIKYFKVIPKVISTLDYNVFCF